MVAAFQQCTASSIPIPEQLQAMILLAAMPPKWEMLIAIITQNYDLADIELKHVCETILAQYESEVTRHGKPKGNKPHDANKLSAVKQKRGNPNFSNKEKGSTQQQSSDKPQGKHGKCGGHGRGNGKGKAADQGHSHIANVASLPVPTTSTIAQIGPSGIQKRTIFTPAPKERTPGPFKVLDAAFDLADQLGVKPTIETVKMLKQHITEQYMNGPWSKSTYHLSDDEGSDIVDMSEVPNGHEGQDNDWDCQFQPASPSNELLDWGSDLEDTKACVPSSSSLLPVQQPTVSLQPPRGLRLLKDGSCSYALPSKELVLSDYVCEHGQNYALCNKCKGKQQGAALWLLDSGASAHFTFSKHNFIEYETIPPNERAPVRTASDTIYVEGKGAVLLGHSENNKLVTTRLYPVLHIPKITTQLLSMGEFLQQGMCVEGTSHSIALLYKNKTMLTCKPFQPGQMTYWLDGTPAEIQEGQTIYSADYELMHRRLGHPSRDIMSHARKNVNGFPSDLDIPSKPPVCPGCAQGKMPASSHPPSDTRASAPFECIHSDLKSFPVVSYHKYKYFVSFFDDFTSYVWIVLLRDKASAILALKQFMATVKTQYNADIKEWMSDAGGEYKSDTFLKTLKDAGIKILQSAPHTPQQNGCTERFMHTVMDKAQSMRLEASLPDSWWEFTVLHAASGKTSLAN
jgi:transposase InsO family protein